MNAPVTAAVPGGRPAAPRASDTGRAHSAAPFASALDGALSETRASDRGVERRTPPADRSERGPDRADRTEARRNRADAKADRVEARQERAETRDARRAARGPGDEAEPKSPVVDGEQADPVAGDEATEEAAQVDAPRGGLPALW